MKQDNRLSTIVATESGNQVHEATLMALLCESLFPILNGTGEAAVEAAAPGTDPEPHKKGANRK